MTRPTVRQVPTRRTTYRDTPLIAADGTITGLRAKLLNVDPGFDVSTGKITGLDLQTLLEPQDSRKPNLERGNSSFDQRHRWVTSAVFQSPYKRSDDGLNDTSDANGDDTSDTSDSNGGSSNSSSDSNSGSDDNSGSDSNSGSGGSSDN